MSQGMRNMILAVLVFSAGLVSAQVSGVSGAQLQPTYQQREQQRVPNRLAEQLAKELGVDADKVQAALEKTRPQRGEMGERDFRHGFMRGHHHGERHHGESHDEEMCERDERRDEESPPLGK